ncbi:heparan-alpha-glucosaminide N-acetyltransferase domain-containing protein [Pseudonocardia alaniniphila]|uniref:heparan-alpha-glucosaminide N-acetyltransferase domain-containing protein n=1 Tax=Pseudonocardia alaniniphila TaxID=75291 RepID=UPI0031E0FF08
MSRSERGVPTRRTRIEGMDLARGIALLAMMAADVFDQVDDKPPPGALAQTVRSDAAAAFVVVAGISLALSFGGDQPLHGRGRTVIRAVIAVQAVLIVVIGLVLGFSNHTTVILTSYGLLCLLTIPLLGCRPNLLARIAALVMVIAPLIATATLDSGAAGSEGNLTFTSLIVGPSGWITGLFVTGSYPVLSYLAFIIAGMAIGRLDLSSVQAVARLFVGGLALVVVGLVCRLALPPDPPVWHSFVHNLESLGSGVGLVGVVLLLVRIPAMTCLLRPITAAGTMALTLYSGYVLILATGVLENMRVEQYLVLLVGALLFAVSWRRFVGEGPLETLVLELTHCVRRVLVTQNRPNRME